MLKAPEKTKLLKALDDNTELRGMMNKDIIAQVEAGKIAPTAARDFIFARLLKKYGAQ